MCYISRYFSATRTAESCFLFCMFQTNKARASSHKIISAVGVFQGRRMLTRLVINSRFGNVTPMDSMLLDRYRFTGKWRTTLGTTGDASETPLWVENCLWGGGANIRIWTLHPSALVSHFSPPRPVPTQKEQRLHCQRTAGSHFARSKKQFSEEGNDPLSFIFPRACLQLLSTTYRRQAPRDRNTNIIFSP